MLQCKILAWNCRGIVNHETQRALVDMVHARNPSLIFLAETLTQPDLLNSIKTRLGFEGCICYQAEEESQGVALLWSADITVNFQSSSPHHIDVEVGKKGSSDLWRFTGLYGFAARTQRHQTWNLIRTLAGEACALPWLMAGDFNEILCQLDKSGGPPRAAGAMDDFRGTMNSCGLYDMGYYGSRFTWSNRFTKERLDRAFQSTLWRESFPFSRVLTLPPSDSDHCPILIEVSAERLQPWQALRRFRFEELWHQYPKCTEIIKQCWAQPLTGNAINQLGAKINNTGTHLWEWHKKEVSKSKGEMRVIQEKMKDIMSHPYTPQQYEEQRQLHVKYSALLAQEETYWRQRSKAFWLKDGDKNTAFFHRKTSNRRSKNRIKGLVDDAVLEAVDERVTPDMNSELTKPYVESEIKDALFQMHPSKSPGLDGMSSFFFQKYWHILSTDVCLGVKTFLETGELEYSANFTHLCLIPKIPDAIEANQYRPIALCNVLYRISSKVMANRLKKLLPSIISPLQSAYVLGRLISDNTLVATEVAHFMHKLHTQQEGFLSLKLDISKAYDKLEWDFLRAILAKMGFHAQRITIIMQMCGLSSILYFDKWSTF
ncbi:uncharacterized protein LOC133729796 [Rosa rugosa]|uniref:uncharacterized protein LOC133729796 n=1 Tax=Rosa rugosa TaxID=74645 RepID=UPI002B417A16|nr:uncharacterized protein LOC133729796 [Rosa rugosa]